VADSLRQDFQAITTWTRQLAAWANSFQNAPGNGMQGDGDGAQAARRQMGDQSSENKYL
jgi:hypothetical protein